MVKTATTQKMEKTEAKKEKKLSVAKELIFSEIDREFRSNPNIFFSRFERLNVQEMSELRRGLEKVSKRSLVVKHSLAKKVLEGMGQAEAVGFLEGTVITTLGGGEAQPISKVLVDFVKGHENVKLRGVIFEGKAYPDSFIRKLAGLPSRHELLTMAVVRFQSPITRFAITLNSLLRSLVIAVNEVHKKKAQAAA